MIKTIDGAWLNPRYITRFKGLDGAKKTHKRVWTVDGACYTVEISSAKLRAQIEQSNGS